MLLLVGIGNPGPAYARNRHNLGWMAADEIVRHHSLPRFRARFHGRITQGGIGDDKVVVLKPETYVNRSGLAVGAAARFYKIPTEQVIVIHDDLDLEPGKVRVKRGGSSGGHLGLEDIDAHIGKGYLRMRIGIGHPGHRDLVTGYVLHDFSKDDEIWVEKTLDAVTHALPLLLQGDESGFMNRVALLARPPGKTPSKARGGSPPTDPATPDDGV
jgi:PTH1 family peptidyl-tRNA hydrolase